MIVQYPINSRHCKDGKFSMLQQCDTNLFVIDLTFSCVCWSEQRHKSVSDTDVFRNLIPILNNSDSATISSDLVYNILFSIILFLYIKKSILKVTYIFKIPLWVFIVIFKIPLYMYFFTKLPSMKYRYEILK